MYFPFLLIVGVFLIWELKVTYWLVIMQEGGKFIPELEDHDGHPTVSKVLLELMYQQ